MLNDNFPKIYSIPQIVKKIHESDPESAVSAPLLRALVKNGSIVPVVNYSNKALLNYDDVISFFKDGYKTVKTDGQSKPLEKTSHWAADEEIFSVATPPVIAKSKKSNPVKSSFFSVDPDIYPVNGGVN